MIAQKYYKAFTIMEVMVTMVLSSFLILASMRVFLMFETLIQLKNKQMDCGKEAMQFYQTIKSDVDRAIIIESRAKEISLAEPDKKLIHYEFEDTYIVRSVGYLTDTFKMEITDFKIVKEPISGFVSSIELETKKCNDEYPIVLSKSYQNDLLMNRTIVK